jgi:transcriptional regulator with XRE-family HTH domain
MYSKIGNIIWKEMKAQGYTQIQLAEKLDAPGLQLSHVFKNDKIDVYLLIQISKVLKKNFFQNLDVDELESSLNLDSIKQLKDRIADLTDRNKEQEITLRKINRQIKRLQKSF